MENIYTISLTGIEVGGMQYKSSTDNIYPTNHFDKSVKLTVYPIESSYSVVFDISLNAIKGATGVSYQITVTTVFSIVSSNGDIQADDENFKILLAELEAIATAHCRAILYDRINSTGKTPMLYPYESMAVNLDRIINGSK